MFRLKMARSHRQGHTAGTEHVKSGMNYSHAYPMLTTSQNKVKIF